MTEAEEQQGVVDKKIVHISEERIKDYLDGQVRQSVEDTLNALLDAEADEICGALITRVAFTAMGEASKAIPEYSSRFGLSHSLRNPIQSSRLFLLLSQ